MSTSKIQCVDLYHEERGREERAREGGEKEREEITYTEYIYFVIYSYF